MALTNYRDISTSGSLANAGFQFEFHCSYCPRLWKSPIRPYRRGQIAGLVHRTMRFIDPQGYLSRGATFVSNVGEQKAHDQALEDAIELAAQHYVECPDCGKPACTDCWEANGRSCPSCAGAHEGSAHRRGSAHGGNGGYGSGYSGGNGSGNGGGYGGGHGSRYDDADEPPRRAAPAAAAISAGSRCPNCSAALSGGRFCPECGFDTASTHKSCPGCGATCLRSARFCVECGHGF